MAYADPQSITYNGTAYSLPRISSGINSGRFYSVMGSTGADLSLEISHQYGKRTRRLARLNVGLVNASPYATGVSAYESTSVYLVVDTPATNGVVDPNVAVLSAKALTGWLVATTDANTLKLVQGQN